MSSQKKITNLLSICIKAGKLVKGFDTVCEELKKGSVFCVMTAADISPKSLKETAFFCEKSDTALLEIPLTKSDIRQLCGKESAVLAVLDKGFAESFIKLSKED